MDHSWFIICIMMMNFLIIVIRVYYSLFVDCLIVAQSCFVVMFFIKVFFFSCSLYKFILRECIFGVFYFFLFNNPFAVCFNQRWLRDTMQRMFFRSRKP